MQLLSRQKSLSDWRNLKFPIEERSNSPLQKSKKTGYFVTLENKNLGNMQFVNIFCIFVALFDYSILFYF